MLANSKVSPTLPVVDLERAKDFYANKLGLTEEKGTGMDDAIFAAGDGTKVYLYKRAQTKADNTACGFEVSNIEEEVANLKSKGVVFEKYDFPGLKTDENGIATIGTIKSAWFKDTEGNILAVNQM